MLIHRENMKYHIKNQRKVNFHLMLSKGLVSQWLAVCKPRASDMEGVGSELPQWHGIQCAYLSRLIIPSVWWSAKARMQRFPTTK